MGGDSENTSPGPSDLTAASSAELAPQGLAGLSRRHVSRPTAYMMHGVIRILKSAYSETQQLIGHD